MCIRGNWGEQRAVSPVVGVILMVAITVLLAATTATFLIGLQDESLTDGPPTVAMSHDLGVESGSYVLRLRHTGGDSVSPETFRVVVSHATCSGSADPNKRYTPVALDNSDSTIAAGSEFELSKRTLCVSGGGVSGDLDLSSASVTVNWIGADGNSGHTLWRWKGPRA